MAPGGVRLTDDSAGINGCSCYIFSSIIVLTPNGNFWVVPALHSVSNISNAGQDGSARKLRMWLWRANFVTLHYSSKWPMMQNFLIGDQRGYVFRTVNYIRSKTLQHRQFKQFPEEVGSYFVGVFYHSAVTWWNRGAALSWFFIFKSHRYWHDWSTRNSTTFMWRVMAVAFTAGKTT